MDTTTSHSMLGNDHRNSASVIKVKSGRKVSDLINMSQIQPSLRYNRTSSFSQISIKKSKSKPKIEGYPIVRNNINSIVTNKKSPNYNYPFENIPTESNY